MTHQTADSLSIPDDDMKGWPTTPAGSWDDRRWVLSLLNANRPGDDDLEFELHYGSHPSKAPPQQGFAVLDMLSGSQDLFDRIVTLPRWNIAFAAFALNGFYVHQDRAAQALERLIPHETSLPLVATIMSSTNWLSMLGPGTGSIDPGVIIAALPAGSSTPPLMRLLWAARKQTGDDLIRIRSDIDARREKLDLEIAANRSPFTALYVLATDQASLLGPRAEPTAGKLHKALENANIKLAKRVHGWRWMPPSEKTLKRWIEVAKDNLTLLEKQSISRPKAPMRTPKPRQQKRT